MSSNRLKIMPLGGLGEVGMNCLILEWQGERVMIDCGIQFPDLRYAGIDYLIPDFSYLRGKMADLRGLVITHGHDDHIGAIPFLARETELDVHCMPFPRGLISSRLAEHSSLKEVRFHRVAPRKVFTVGPFSFDPLPVRHSIIETVGYGIKTPVGNIVHTGDFKQDLSGGEGAKYGWGHFKEWAKKGVKLLLSDSTNAERHGHTMSEAAVRRSFESIMAEQNRRMLIALFSSNIRRIENILHVAKRKKKYVALAGRSMNAYIQLAHEQGAIRIPEDTLVLLENIQKYPDERVVILTTGSQAEQQSVLVRVAQGMHKHIRIRNGDLVLLSSRFIPGNERAITSMINQLYRLGAEVTYEAIHGIHVSGHGFQDELTGMLRNIKPTFFVPVHGEYRHLSTHARLARLSGVQPENIKVIENGQAIELSSKELHLGEKWDLVKGVVVGNARMDPDLRTFVERSRLQRTGVVSVVLLRKAGRRELVCPPVIKALGVVWRQGLDPQQTLEQAEQHLASAYPQIIQETDEQEAIRLCVRRFFRKQASHKPMVMTTVVDL